MKDQVGKEEPVQYRQMRGCVEIAMYNARTKERLFYKRFENAVATAGRSWNLAHMLSGEGATAEVLSHMAIGTDATAPTTGDTTLGSEVARKLVGTWDTVGLTSTTPYFRGNVQFQTDEANTTLTEVGFFNSSAVGTMLAHATFATQDKTTDNTFGVTYTISN